MLDDSPTRRVGFKPLSEFSEHRHLGRLWSMDKVRTEGELIEWSRRAERLRDEYNQAHPDSPLPKLRYALEYKFDGLTINLTYDGGKLVQAATRGNGVTGEAILPQAMTIRTIPLTIPVSYTHLQKYDGSQLLHRIKTMGKGKGTVFIGISALYTDEAIRMAQSAGFAYMIALPCAPLLIAQRVDELMDVVQNSGLRDTMALIDATHMRCLDCDDIIAQYLTMLGLAVQHSGFVYAAACIKTVSYTHLDVYKRQA